MRTLAVALAAIALQDPPQPAPFVKLKEGVVWTYVTGDKEGKVRVTGREKIGDVEAFVLATELSGASTEKEYVVVDATGIKMLRQTSGSTVTDYATPFVRLKLPPVAGDKWEWKGDIGKDKATVAYTNDGEEEITVPAGKYKAWKITAVMEIGGVKHTGVNWFAPGVGLVRQQSEFETGGKKHKSVIELKLFEPGS